MLSSTVSERRPESGTSRHCASTGPLGPCKGQISARSPVACQVNVMRLPMRCVVVGLMEKLSTAGVGAAVEVVAGGGVLVAAGVAVAVLGGRVGTGVGGRGVG